MDEPPIVLGAEGIIGRADGQWVLGHLRAAEAEYARAETEMERAQATAHYYASLSLLGREVPIMCAEDAGRRLGMLASGPTTSASAVALATKSACSGS